MQESQLRIIKKLKAEYQKIDNFIQTHVPKFLSDLEQHGPDKYWVEWESYDGGRHKVTYTKSEWLHAEKEYNANQKKYHNEIVKHGKLKQLQDVMIDARDQMKDNKISDKYISKLKQMKFTDTQINELEQEFLQFKDDIDLYTYLNK